MFHTGLRKMFPLNREALARIIRPEKLRWIAFGHYEAEECGAMNEWSAVAPNARVTHGHTGCLVSLNDMADRKPKKSMKTCATLPIILLLLGLTPAVATVRIGEDGGGQIGAYLAKYRALKASGERIEIDGTCASACTMLLGIIPRNRICVTPRASLVFHSAWDLEGDQTVAANGNRILWSIYPENVRKWIKRHGGLHSQLVTLRGPELAAMFPVCR